MHAGSNLATTGNPEQRRILSHILVTEEGPVRVLAFKHDERGQVHYDTVRAYLSSLMLEHTHGWHRLVIDLSGVPALDSAALGPMMQKLREVQEARGCLVLTGVQAAALREILSLTGFARVFNIQATRATAVVLAAT